MATVQLGPAAGSDDAWEGAGATTLTGTSLALTAGTRYGGFRLDATSYVALFPGRLSLATFNYKTTTSTDDTDGVYWGHKVVTPATFSTSPGTNISDRMAAKTTASASDVASNIGTGWRTIDVTAIMQELTSQAGWTGPLALIMDCGGGANWHPITYENESNIWYVEFTYLTARPALHYARLMGG